MSDSPRETRLPTNGRVELFDNVFDPQFCTFLLRESQAKLAHGREFSRSNYQWNSNIVRASLPVLVRDYDDSLSDIILSQLIKRGVIETNKFAVMNYAWSRLSYIPWHDDPDHETAVTVYLNDRWDHDWGGIFLYVNNAAQICGHLPRFNTCVRNSGHVLHSTTMVTPDADGPRLTLQIFPKQSQS
jgi:hypothetical protein